MLININICLIKLVILKISIFLWVHGRDVICRHHYMEYWFCGLTSFQALAQKEDSFWAWISLLTNKCLDQIQVQIRDLHIFFFLFLCLYPYFIEPRDPCIIVSNFICNDKEKYIITIRWLSGKESTYQAGDPASIPGSGRSPKKENSNPLQYSYLENSMDKRAWWAQSMGSQSWIQFSELCMYVCMYHTKGENSFFLKYACA